MFPIHYRQAHITGIDPYLVIEEYDDMASEHPITVEVGMTSTSIHHINVSTYYILNYQIYLLKKYYFINLLTYCIHMFSWYHRGFHYI